MSFLNAVSKKKCKGSRLGNGPRDRSPAYGSPEESSEEKARLIKLNKRLKEIEEENQRFKEELKQEKNKNRVSKQESAELKAQLQEAKKKEDTNKITDSAVSSSPVPKMTLAQRFTEHGSDEVRDSITDICSYCASKGNLRPATHFCLDCGVYGRYICGECLQSHNMFVYDHVAETIAMQSKNRRKQLQNDLAAERRKTESTAKELAGAIQELQIHKEKREQLQTDLLTERLKSESIAKELAGALQELESHKEKRLIRLSSDAFSLTDQNRPTKIAEKLQELYDNQWTDAFDVLDGEMDERQIIQTLLDALMRISDECRRLSNFFERVQRSIESPIEATGIPKTSLLLSDQFKQQIKGIRIFRTAAVAKEIEKIIKPNIKLANHPATDVQDYLSHCVEICWLCAVQDPPLILKAQSSLEFDTNAFKDYTMRGKYVEFVVWPALYLNEGGALLAKGIAQGTGNKTLSTRDNAEF